ncbi:MAG: hypothetical protein WC309_03395 [Candidatus Paceibacterota bacterium]|jgi:hypothetical protein
MMKKITVKKMKLRGFWVISIPLLAILSLIYVFQVNAITNNAYNIANLQKETKKIAQNNEGLEVKITQQAYLPNATKIAENLLLEKINRIEYLNVAQGVAVAK